MNILFGVFSTRDDLPEVLKSISKDFNILNHMIMTGVDKTWAMAHGLAHGPPYGLPYGLPIFLIGK